MQGTRPKILGASPHPQAEPAPLVYRGRSEGLQAELVRRWQWLIGGAVGVLVLCGTAALINGQPSEVRGKHGAVAPDKQALLTLTEQDYAALDAQAQLQIDESYRRLIDLEAVRFLAEAEQQSTDATAACYRQGVECVLDQFESDALAMYQQGADTLDRALQIDALLRLQIVDQARTGLRIAQEPDNALTATAIMRRLDARQFHRAASAESQAAELLGD